MCLRIFLIFSSIFLIFSGCRNENNNVSSKNISETKKTFVTINKALVAEDRTLIEAYIKRHKLEGMKESGTGLYYFIWGEPLGNFIKTGDIVEYRYKITLLDGTLCYQSEPNSPKRFSVGRGVVESGLEQAVVLMKQGQKGKFILPPHLAYGLQGDFKMIPPRSIIVYDIEMLNVYR